ncbi:efflux RND transporter permease subunit [Chryseobacterium sp.]|mgnify:CR=1 FL=1|uniref:efflux RND transporter permease subunit n=1 Tax=Chryseobacterium sp. TaxID=1871047 RepID=UPI0025C175E6|nr:efflux RND transporter permease subunit [Chryseobacterium sp.]
MVQQFIRRPVLSIVISLFILLLGLLSLVQLPMTQFPNIAPPSVNVTVEYTGANSETVTKAAVVPLERAINGVPGMKYMSSDAGNDGTGTVQIIFEVGVDPDIAAVNVQNRVSAVMGELPEEVIKNGVKIAKEENAILMYIDVFSNDPSMEEKFLYNFADINLLPELKRIKGVGFVDVVGAKEYAMRIWLKPDKMLNYGISTSDISQALKAQNIEAAPGKVGESNEKKAESLQYVVKYSGRFNTVEQYEQIPVRAGESGEILRIKDVADIEFGTSFFDINTKMNGKPASAIQLKQLPGSNAREVISEVKKRLAEIKDTTFKKGMNYEVSYDVSKFLDASVHEVIKTLIEALILVILVVYLFLQDFRSTIIPAITVPVSLIGTFLFMNLFGFSLNLITLFAMVLAIGIVIDDAIVVVEAVHAKLDLGLPPKQATAAAMKEISGAIMAITLVMAAVFIPAAFMSGPVGIFFKQFSVTMAISIILSGVGALTLTPALCAILLKGSHNKEKNSLLKKFFTKFNKGYDHLSLKYKKILSAIINRKLITFIALILFCLGTGLLNKILPAGFIPNEDQGTFYISVTTPAGSTLERTDAVVNEIQRVCKDIPAIRSISTMAGSNILSKGTGATYGTCLINLKNWEERDESLEQVIETVKEKISHIKDAQIEIFPPPTVPGYGNASGFELRLLDKTGTDNMKQMEDIVNKFKKDLKERPEIASAFTNFNASYPQYMLNIDYDKAAQKGVTVENALGSLQTMLGSEYATNFLKFGMMYKVMVQILPEYRAKPEDLLKLYVKNDRSEMVPLSAFAELKKSYGVDQITRYNMYTSAEVNGSPADGYSSSDAITAIKETAKEKLPPGYDIAWAGMTQDEVSTGNQSIYIFVICLLFVYLLLSAQYESFLLPLVVILSLPVGIFGAYFLLYLLGLENNIYAQVAIVMLVGLLGKNAILIVEFASLKHKEGASPFKAAIEGAVARLRPILMTSFAFIAGLIPLLIASGAGATGNRTIGAAAAGGMLFGTLFGIIIIPGLYVVFATIADQFNSEHVVEPLTEDF